MLKLWYNTFNMRAGPTVETPSETPRERAGQQPEVSVAEQPTQSLLEKLKLEIIALPVKAADVGSVAVPAGTDREKVLRQEVDKRYNEVERKISLAVESGVLTKDDAKNMERFLQQKREELAKEDPYLEGSNRDNVLTRGIAYLQNYAHAKANEGTLVTNAVDGAANFAAWSGISHGLGAATTALLTRAAMGSVAGPAGIVAGVIGGIGGGVLIQKAGALLSKVGIPPKVGGLIAKAGAILAVAALSPASLPAMGASALVGLVMYGANRAVQTANEEQRKRQALSAMGAAA